MTREERLSFCKICKNQKLDFKQGIVCGLTNAPAEFENSCDSFSEDITLKNEALFKEFENIHEPVDKGIRFANFILDLIFNYIFSFIFGIILGLVLFVVSPDSLTIFDQQNLLLEYLMGFVFSMIYYTTFEATTGRSLAKYITKTKVVDKNGNKPSLNTILLRSLCRFIPFEPFSFLGSESKGWHDSISETKVVKA
ncbi:RDD family protein [uncultured Tenacibaculum sp.]|uniref:RDD family protein n=1 Tax=uncultured Tenacibaculum sp. TaxID=174713 RepID=UPI00260B0CA1|nr:RDD family protein [uncultured Tenacibaculum sp.]